MKAAILALAVVLALSGVQSTPAAAVEAPAIKSGPAYVVEHGTEYILHAITQHDDVVIVTDIKENCAEGAKLIAERYPQLRDRFYIQIYNTQDYEAVSALGFQNIILTVYQMTWAEKADVNALVAFASSHTLAGITFPIDLVDLIPGYLETLVASGTPVFVHTVNDAETQQMLFDAGVAGVYTDGMLQ